MEQLIDYLNHGIIEDGKRDLFEQESEEDRKKIREAFTKDLARDRRNMEQNMRQRLKTAVRY